MIEEHLAGREKLVVAFSSRPDRFEWGRTLHGFGLDHVLLRDNTERWWRHGVTGVGDLWDVVAYIERLSCRYAWTKTLGLSSGSYGALLYGHLALVDEVIAVSPLTGKGDAIKAEFEPQWHHRIEHGPEHPPVLDLRRLFRGHPACAVTAFVSDGEGTELDAQMCRRICVTPREVPGHSHSLLGRALRDSGELGRALLSDP